MTQSGTDKGFEFGSRENELLLGLSRDLTRLGISVLVAGVLFVLYLVVSFIDPSAVLQVSDARHTLLSVIDYAVWGLIALLVIYMSVTIIKLAVPVKMIATTAGLDIAHLMDFVKDLGRLSRVSFASLMVVCVLMVISLFMLVLVF
ncbi:MAG: hypothetical protein A4E61_01821 [Syntrophorhabdus sp. PtaB.Bin184]|nr:MAG: hypothetical protein A4E61_01821 [Syntrophorhabdus sp. PtaB.Bin184]